MFFNPGIPQMGLDTGYGFHVTGFMFHVSGCMLLVTRCRLSFFLLLSFVFSLVPGFPSQGDPSGRRNAFFINVIFCGLTIFVDKN